MVIPSASKLWLLMTYAVVVMADAIIRIKQKRHRRKMRPELLARAKTPSVIRYCNYNQEIYGKPVGDRRAVVLMDCFPIPIWVAANSVLAHCLAERHQATICSYGNTERDPYADALYNSFNCRDHFVVALSREERKRRRALFCSVVGRLKTNHDLFNLEIDGVQIGDEIYETYLGQFNKPTVDVSTLRCKYSIFVGLTYFIYFESFFKRNRVVAAVLSHDIYTPMGIPAKIAWKNRVPVFLANGHEMKRTLNPNDKNQEFRRYSEYFGLLSKEDQGIGLDWARGQLGKRLGGQVGVDMGYSTKSAFVGERLARQTSLSGKTKVVIATHCFFDNPRAYGGSLFIDYREWLSFLGQISEVTDYEWYIKTHRDYLPGTLETIREIIKEHPKLQLIDSNTSWHQLQEEGVSVALTSYGSIGHELPLLGLKVINAGYNPHIAYAFNWHPQTIEEYRDLLMGLPTLGAVREPEKVYEFYFVHYRLAKGGGFLFDSFSDMQTYVAQDVHSTLILDKVVAGGRGLHDQARSIIYSFIGSERFSVGELFLYESHK